MSDVITKIATREAKSLVKSMFWQLPQQWKNELGFIVAKGAAIVAVRRMLMQYNNNQNSILLQRYKVLKALPKAINELKYKKPLPSKGKAVR